MVVEIRGKEIGVVTLPWYLRVTGALYRKTDPKIATVPKTQSRNKGQK